MLCDTYIFYADVYFVQNLMIKIAVLFLSLYANKCYFAIQSRRGIARIILVAGLGTIVELLGLWMSNSYNFLLLLVSILEIPIMFFLLLGERKETMITLILSGYFFTMIINATLELLWNWFGESGGFVFYLGTSCFMVYIGFCVYQNLHRMKKGLFQVEISHKNHRISTHGFYDSGNRLKDPYTGKGVHIISEKLLKQLDIQKGSAVLVPYHSLGNEMGMIEVYYVEELIIGENTNKRYWQNSPIGVTKENLFKDGMYEIILNEEVF